MLSASLTKPRTLLRGFFLRSYQVNLVDRVRIFFLGNLSRVNF